MVSWCPSPMASAAAARTASLDTAVGIVSILYETSRTMTCLIRGDRGRGLEMDLMAKTPRRTKQWWPVAVLAGLLAALLMSRRSAGTRVEGLRWYGLVYRTAYLLGLRVWDRGVPTAGLVELVEGASASGRALDL